MQYALILSVSDAVPIAACRSAIAAISKRLPHPLRCCALSTAAAKANRDASFNLQEQAHPSQHPLVRVDAIEPLDRGL